MLHWFYSSHIQRPLSDDGEYFYSVPYHKWQEPMVFAQLFRVPSLDNIRTLSRLLLLPAEVHANRTDDNDQPISTYRANRDDALAVCLARLCFPGRLSDLKHRLQLNWSLSKISYIIKATVMNLFGTWRERVLFDRRVFSNPGLLAQYAQAIHAVGAGFTSCIGFIDGTTFHISRPGGGDLQQAAFYS